MLVSNVNIAPSKHRKEGVLLFICRSKFVLSARKQYFTTVQHYTVAVPVASVSSKPRRSSPSPAHTISSAVTAALISKPKSTPQISPIACSISQTLLAPTLNRSSIESCCDGQEVHSDPNSRHRCRILCRLRLVWVHVRERIGEEGA